MFLNLEDVKRVGPIKTPTSKRNSSVQSPSTQLPRENHRSSLASSDGSVDKQGWLNNKDQRPVGSSSSEGGTILEIPDPKRLITCLKILQLYKCQTQTILRGNVVPWSKRMNCNSKTIVEGLPSPIRIQSSWKQELVAIEKKEKLKNAITKTFGVSDKKKFIIWRAL